MNSSSCVNACVGSGVVITPLVVRPSYSNAHCHHTNLSNTTSSLANLRLSSEPRLGCLSATDSSGSRSQSPGHYIRHHCHTMSSSLDSSTPSPENQLSRQVVIRPAYELSSPKRLQSPDILVPSKSTPIDAPVDQSSLLPPPLIPVPAGRQALIKPDSRDVASTKLQQPTRTKPQSMRRSIPSSTPPPIPTRRSLGNVREEPLPPSLTPSNVSTPPPASVAAPRPAQVTNVETENKDIRAADAPSNECAVCLENVPDCVLYTCGHMCMCYACAIDVVRSRGALCPICRQPIRDVIKIFRS